MASVLVVSDTHWPAVGSMDNWVAITSWLADHPVDLAIHAGDATWDGAHQPEQLAVVRGLLDGLAIPWQAVPGNHDIGDPATPASRAGWVGEVGEDVWATRLGAWSVIGLDSQVLGAGPSLEDEQWARLADLAEHAAEHVALVTHKPIHASDDERASSPGLRFLPVAAEARLSAMLGDRLRLVLSGHVHQSRELTAGAVRHVWAPSIWGTIPEERQRTVGAKRCGALTVNLADDGSMETADVEPDGLAQHVIGETIPNPYEPA